MDLGSEPIKFMHHILNEHNSTSFSSGEKVIITSSHKVSPVLQEGPTCGLVCITMAGQLLQGKESIVPGGTLNQECKLHVENILSYAKQECLSKKGEMFSVHSMKQIVRDYLLWQAEVLDTETQDWSLEDMMIDVLLGQSVVLMPYDADKDHSPCLAGGHSAHWCVLVGVGIVLECIGSLQPTTEEILEHCYPTSGHSSHYTISPVEFAHHLRACFNQHPLSEYLENNQIYVLARQGKSVHLGLWSLKDLLESNANLREIDPKRSNLSEYVIPDGGFRKELKNKIVVIRRK